MKQQAIEDWFSNPRSQKEVAEKYGMPVDTFSNWLTMEIKKGRVHKTPDKPKEQPFWVVSSYTRENTFFIFRECGSEVEVKISGLKYWANKRLTKNEIEHIKNEILK